MKLVHLALLGCVSSIQIERASRSDPVCPSSGCDELIDHNIPPPPKKVQPVIGKYEGGKWSAKNETTTSNKTFPLVYPDDALHTAQVKRMNQIKKGEEVPVNLVFLPDGEVLTPEDQGMEIPVNLVFLPSGQVISADDFDNEGPHQSQKSKNQAKYMVLAQNLEGVKDKDDETDVETLEEKEARAQELAAAKKVALVEKK